MEALVTIINKSGVHARPAAMLAQMGRRYTSKITYTAKGDDEQEAIKALSELVNNRFGEHQ